MQVMKNTVEVSNSENGCLMYKLYADYQNGNVFWLTESWATVMDLKNHVKTFQKLKIELGEVLQDVKFAMYLTLD